MCFLVLKTHNQKHKQIINLTNYVFFRFKNINKCQNNIGMDRYGSSILGFFLESLVYQQKF
jgi:hypothetical protein